MPGNNPDINSVENIGAIIKDKFKGSMGNEDRQNRYNYDILKTNLKNTQNDTDLFIDLLCSMRRRFDATKAAEQGHSML